MAFWCGWVALAAAFGPPLHALTEVSFAAHMTQHEILMLVAAPLLVLARPQGILMWGMPGVLANAAAAVTRSRRARHVFAMLVTPIGAWLLHLAALWGWHVPAAFDAAARHEGIHWIQHLSFFLSALVFWYSVLAPGRGTHHGAPAVVSLFATAAHTSVLGVLLTFSSSVWYRSYAAGASGLSALEDQQLGGLIMWIPGGMVFVAAALAIVGSWLTSPQSASAMPSWRAEP